MGKKFFAMLLLVASLGAMTNAIAYTCNPGETSLLDSYTFPNDCGGSSLALLLCENGNIRMSVTKLSCRQPDTEAA